MRPSAAGEGRRGSGSNGQPRHRGKGITGDELLAFINQEECIRPEGSRGLGLFAYLRKPTSSKGDDCRDVIATVFRGVDNRMKSGYLLRDVVNKVAGIRFTSTDELHTLGALYESMLREMRDAAGDSGELYTPRAVVRFMVAVTDPRLGETVLDPASGTGGFLVESFNHLSKQVKTIADRKQLRILRINRDPGLGSSFASATNAAFSSRRSVAKFLGSVRPEIGRWS
jgi:type I restriction enzyme M protein